MASISTRTKKDGSKSYMVRWRDSKTRSNQGLTVATLIEAETLKRLLDANGQSFEIAQHAILSNEKRTPTMTEERRCSIRTNSFRLPSLEAIVNHRFSGEQR